MLKLFNNERLILPIIGKYILCFSIIVSSIVSFITTKDYLDNHIIAIINLLNLAFCSMIVVSFIKNKGVYKVHQSPVIYSTLLITPMFMMVMSNYSLALLMNLLLSVLIYIILVQQRVLIYYCIASILINILLVKFTYLYSSQNIIDEYLSFLQDDVFALLLCLVNVLSIVSLIFRRQIELEIRINGMKTVANVLANEMFTPLAVIETTARLLNIEETKKPLLESLVQTSRNARHNINFLIHNIKTIRGLKSFNKKKYSLELIVTECIKEFECHSQLRSKISLTVNNDIKFIGYNAMIKCMIDNILRNAFQHCGVDIHVDVLISGNNLIFQDNGCGINQSEVDNIFDLFYSSVSSNLGIGLPLCKEIIKSHGGEINCISLEGSHTTFIIKFPNIS